MSFIPVIMKLYFQHHFFSVTWSFRSHSNMLICSSRNIAYYYSCWKQLYCLIFIFLSKSWYIFVAYFDEPNIKKQHLFKIEIFWNIIIVFTFSLNPSLLYKKNNKKYFTYFTHLFSTILYLSLFKSCHPFKIHIFSFSTKLIPSIIGQTLPGKWEWTKCVIMIQNNELTLNHLEVWLNVYENVTMSFLTAAIVMEERFKSWDEEMRTLKVRNEKMC